MMNMATQMKLTLGLSNPKRENEPTFLNFNPSLGYFCGVRFAKKLRLNNNITITNHGFLRGSS